ncbi:MAG: ATP-binding cassette domain-containing protein, partial [Clostridia bacterium]
MSNYAIEMRGITKTFGSVIANKNVNLTVKEGEILSLLGENGSGKTTLMNMLSGIYQPDGGEILLGGKPVTIHSPEDSKKLGIGMVHQHFKLVDVFTAADNIWLGKENSGTILRKNRFSEISEMCQKFGFDIDPTKKVHNMAVSEKQTLEILKVLYYGAKIIILDEPTAVLTVQETKKLFDVLRQMKKDGHAVIIITHKLNEVLDISDRVAILRKGEYITTVNTKETSEQELTELMVGMKIDLNIDRPQVEKTPPLLEIRNLKIKNDEDALAIDDVNFYIRGGEIMGVAGIAGCGQKELCEAIAGLRPIVTGSMIHKGDNIVGLSPKAIIEKGISMSFIPEDRLGMGLAPSLSITDNMILKNYADSKGFLV